MHERTKRILLLPFLQWGSPWAVQCSRVFTQRNVADCLWFWRAAISGQIQKQCKAGEKEKDPDKTVIQAKAQIYRCSEQKKEAENEEVLQNRNSNDLWPVETLVPEKHQKDDPGHGDIWDLLVGYFRNDIDDSRRNVCTLVTCRVLSRCPNRTQFMCGWAGYEL